MEDGGWGGGGCWSSRLYRFNLHSISLGSKNNTDFPHFLKDQIVCCKDVWYGWNTAQISPICVSHHYVNTITGDVSGVGMNKISTCAAQSLNLELFRR